MKLLSGIMTGLTGGLQLYSGVKRLFGEKERQRQAERILANARAKAASKASLLDELKAKRKTEK